MFLPAVLLSRERHVAKFDDYHRTVVGYHGTGLAAALRIVNRIEGFVPANAITIGWARAFIFGSTLPSRRWCGLGSASDSTRRKRSRRLTTSGVQLNHWRSWLV